MPTGNALSFFYRPCKNDSVDWQACATGAKNRRCFPDRYQWKPYRGWRIYRTGALRKVGADLGLDAFAAPASRFKHRGIPVISRSEWHAACAYAFQFAGRGNALSTERVAALHE